MTDKKNVHETPAAESDDDSRQSRTFLAIALVVSVAAHVVVAWLASGKLESRDVRRSKPQHISLVTLARKPAAAEPTEPTAPIQPTAPTPPTEPTEPIKPTAPTQPSEATGPASPRPSTAPTNSDGPRTDRRLPGGIAGNNGLSFPTLPSGESGSQKALDRLNGLGTTAPTDAPNANGGKIDPNADLQSADAASKAAKTYSKPDFNQDGASPPRNAKLSANERAENGLSAMKTEAAEQNPPAKNKPAPPSLAALETQGGRKFEPPSNAVAASVKKCKTCQHEVGRLSCLVDVTRSDGAAPAFLVTQSSGDPTFDAAALDAVKAALPNNAAGFVWSRFKLSAEVYHFSTMEMLLDPGFKPPGRRLASKDSGATSMTTSVRLVDFH